MPSSPQKIVEEVVIPLVFGLCVVIFDAMALLYIIIIHRRRDHFQVRLRQPDLWIADILLLFIPAVTTIGLREVCVASGVVFPCGLQDLSFVLATADVFCLGPLRTVQLIVVFDQQLRKAYHRYFRAIKITFLFVSFFLACLFFLLLEQDKVVGCFNR